MKKRHNTHKPTPQGSLLAQKILGKAATKEEMLQVVSKDYQPISVMWLEHWQLKLAMGCLLVFCYALGQVTEVRLNRLTDEVDNDQLKKAYLSGKKL